MGKEYEKDCYPGCDLEDLLLTVGREVKAKGGKALKAHSKLYMDVVQSCRKRYDGEEKTSFSACCSP